MLRQIVCLALMVTTPPIFSVKAIDHPANYVGFNFVKIPPIESNKSLTISFSACFDNFIINQYGLIKVKIANSRTNNVPIECQSVTFRGYRITSTLTVSSIYLVTSNNVFTFELYDEGMNLIDDVYLNAYNARSTTINVVEGTTTYLSPLCFAYTNKDKTYYASERFTFANFASFYETDYYSRIDITKFEFGYSDPMGGKPLTYGSATFGINPAEYFPNFGELSSQLMSVPIEIYLVGSVYHFRFATTLYVDPLTKEMSTIQKEGFAETEYLYLPRAEYGREDFNFQITINEAGYTKSKIIYSSTYFPRSGYIGDCSNSEYCIGVASSNPDFELGTVELKSK